MRPYTTFLVIASLISLSVTGARGEDVPSTTEVKSEVADQDGNGNGQSLDSKATDPTASLMVFNFTEIWNLNYWDEERPGYAFRFRPAIPFNLWGVDNILRVTLIYDHGGLPGFGLEDVQIFDLLVFPAFSGRIGIGPLFNLASAGSATPSPFSIGPAIGYVYNSKTYNAGLFSQNVFGDDFGTSFIQPILTVRLGHGVDLGPGDFQFTYDWEKEEWITIPLGFQLGYLVNVARQPIRFYGQYQYNFRDATRSFRNEVQIGMVLLVP